MQAKIIDRKWVVEWFDERQCYHMPSLTLADNGNLLAVWNGGFLQWNGDPMGRDAKDWVSVLEPGAKEWSNPDAVGCDIRYCCHDPVFLKNKKGEIILLFAKFLDTEVNFTTWCNGRDELWTRKTKAAAHGSRRSPRASRAATPPTTASCWMTAPSCSPPQAVSFRINISARFVSIFPTTTARHGKKAPSSLRTMAISSGSRRFAFGRTAPSVCSRAPVRAVRAGARA